MTGETITPTLYHECLSKMTGADGLGFLHSHGAGRGPAKCARCGARVVVSRVVYDAWELDPAAGDCSLPRSEITARRPTITVGSARKASAMEDDRETWWTVQRRTVATEQ